MATILTKRSNTASSVPVAGDLTNSTGGAELAVNTADKRLFTKDSGGTVVELGTNPSSVTLPNGTANGVAYLNGSKVLTSGSALTFDGTQLGVSGSGAYQQFLRLNDSSGANKFVDYGWDGTGAYLFTPAPYYAFNVNATEAMRLTSTGLGIGTSSPSGASGTTIAINGGAGQARLALKNTSTGDASGDGFQIALDNTAGGIEMRENLPLYFTTNNTERARIDSSGNVGIGTSSPSAAKLVVRSGTGTAHTVLGNDYGSLYLETASGGPNRITSLNSALNASQALAFNGAGGAEWGRFDSSGNLLVGTTTNTFDGKLFVESTKGTQVAVTHNNSTGQVFFSNGVAAAGTGWRHFNGVSSNNTVQNIIIYGNGNIQNANNSYGAISDAKLKENIVDATPKLEKLQQVRVVNYNLKGDYEQHKQLGVIAQELEQIFPGMVEESPDRDAEGNDLGTTTKSVKYSVFVPMLIKAIQEQQAIINELKARLDAANL